MGLRITASVSGPQLFSSEVSTIIWAQVHHSWSSASPQHPAGRCCAFTSPPVIKQHFSPPIFAGIPICSQSTATVFSSSSIVKAVLLLLSLDTLDIPKPNPWFAWSFQEQLIPEAENMNFWSRFLIWSWVQALWLLMAPCLCVMLLVTNMSGLTLVLRSDGLQRRWKLCLEREHVWLVRTWRRWRPHLRPCDTWPWQFAVMTWVKLSGAWAT